MARYQQSTIKRLWRLSAGLCAFDGCRAEISEDSGQNQMAHIVAQGRTGPRADPAYPTANLDSYDNLILLCPNHHSLVDSEEITYTSERLTTMKRSHESWVRERLSMGKPWKVNVSDFYYFNAPRVVLFASMCGRQIDASHIEAITGFSGLGFAESMRAMIQAEEIVGKLQANAVSITEVARVMQGSIGAIAEFGGSFRTKNGPKSMGEYLLTGSIDSDPHIYRASKEYNGFELVLPYDPRWLVTTTSLAMFNAGSFECAGLCRVRGIDEVGKRIIGSPMFIGVPKPTSMGFL